MTEERIFELARKWGMFATGVPQIKGFARDIELASIADRSFTSPLDGRRIDPDALDAKYRVSASIADTATNYVPEDAQIESEARLYSLDLANGLDWCFDDFNLKAFVRALFLQRGEK